MVQITAAGADMVTYYEFTAAQSPRDGCFIILALIYSRPDLPSLFIIRHWLPPESYDFPRLQASLDYPAIVRKKYVTGTPPGAAGLAATALDQLELWGFSSLVWVDGGVIPCQGLGRSAEDSVEQVPDS